MGLKGRYSNDSRQTPASCAPDEFHTQHQRLSGECVEEKMRGGERQAIMSCGVGVTRGAPHRAPAPATFPRSVGSKELVATSGEWALTSVLQARLILKG